MHWYRPIWAHREKAPIRLPGAIEISTEGVFAAVLRPNEDTPHCAFESFSHQEDANDGESKRTRDSKYLTTGISDALDGLVPTGRSVAVLIPDVDVHVNMLEFDTLPERTELAEAIVRLRLKKVSPNNVDLSSITFQIIRRSHSQCKVIVLSVAKSVLERYESAVIKAGFRPGIVLPAAMGLIQSLQPQRPILLAYLAVASITTCICSGSDLILYRTVDLRTHESSRAAEIDHAIAVASAFFEDALKQAPKCLYLSISNELTQASVPSAEWKLPVVQLPSAAVGMTSPSISAFDEVDDAA